MPKRSKVIKVGDPNNVRNPFSSVKTEADDESGTTNKRKSKIVDAEEVNLTTPDNCDEVDAPAVISDVKEEPNFNLYCGTEIGLLKGIALGGELPISKNIYKPDLQEQKPPAVLSLTWTDDSEKDLLVALSNLVVKTYNTKLKSFTRQIILDGNPDNEKVIGLCCQNLGSTKYVFGLEDGTVSLWSCIDAAITLSLKTCKGDSDLRKIRQCPSDTTFYATGGRENDLKIWNLASETPEVPVFKAKNVPHDNLDLRVPVWIQDLTFLTRTTEVVAVGTRYGQVRLYDVRAGLRPVSNVQFADHPIMSITSTMDDRKVIVGTARGEAGMYDLRNPGKEKLCLKYTGFSGSIRRMVACPDQPYVVSAGLDRHLYIHKFSERAPIKKLYLKQQVNCIALTKSFMKESVKMETSKGVKESDWANIPPEVLDISLPLDVETASPPKKLRKAIRS